MSAVKQWRYDDHTETLVCLVESVLTGETKEVEIHLPGFDLDMCKTWEDWLAGDGLIQDVLPGVSSGDRELLISGIGDSDWDKLYRDEE